MNAFTRELILNCRTFNKYMTSILLFYEYYRYRSALVCYYCN